VKIGRRPEQSLSTDQDVFTLYGHRLSSLYRTIGSIGFC
jgi:hypothetical protein